MLEDTRDPRPPPDLFAQAIAARAAEHGHGPGGLARWFGAWHDRAGAWTKLRNLEHWIERSGA
jgi:hypothetical protein